MSTPTIIEYLSEQLEQTRENHPSFSLMNNKIDDNLFPNGIVTYEAEAKDSNNEIKKVKEIVADSWSKGSQNHLTILGEGGIGKTVTLLSLPDRLAPHTVPAIYIPLHDIVGGDDIDDMIERYIKKWVLDDDEELFRQLKVLRKTAWKNGPQLLLLLDGFNELSSEKLRGAISRDIEHWANKYKGVQIITSSRYDIHNYVFTQSVFSKIELRTITKEKVVEYLNKAGDPVPVNTTVLELITNPLLLTLYIKTESVRNDRRSSFARFRETKNAGTLIWNYLQCELWRFRNRETQDAKTCVIAMEFIAPYVAWTMQQQSRFSMDESAFHKSIEIACNLLKDHIEKHDTLPQHIEITLQQSHGLSESDHFGVLLKEQLSLFVGFEIKDENTKKGNGKSDIRYKLMHQQFRDALAAMHLINLSYLSGDSLPQEWNTPIDHYVMQFVADLISEGEAMQLWEQNRKTVPTINDATRNQLRLQGLLHNNDYSHLDFSGLDLRNISLFPYRNSKTTIKLPAQREKMKKTKLSDKTFSPAGHEGTVNAVAVTPDGKRIVSGSDDHTIRVWDLETGAAIGKPIKGHKNSVNAVAVTPDGKRIVSGSDDRTIRVWDLETGAAIGNPIKGYEGGVIAITVSPDGKRIVSGSGDHTIRVWDIETGAAIGKPIEGHKGWVNAVVVTPDGKQIISGSDDGTIRVWELETGTALIKPINGHEYHPVTAVAVTPDGKRIVSGSDDRTIRVWDLETGAAIGNPIKGHKHWVNAVAVTPDGKRIVSGSYDSTIRIWDLETGAAIENPIEGHKSWVNTVAVTPDGKRIVSGSGDYTIRVWDLETGAAIGNPIEGHEGWVNAVAVMPDGRHIISGSDDHIIRIWDMETGTLLGKPFLGHKDRIAAIALTSEGKYIVSGSNDSTICVWDIETGKLIGEPIRGHEGVVAAVVVTPDGKRIISGSWDRTIRIWDICTGKQIGKPIIGHEDKVDAIALTPDGKRFISASSDGSLRIWDVETREQVGKTIKASSEWVRAVAVTPDGKHIVSGSDDGVLCIWDINKCEIIGKPVKGNKRWINAVAVTPDGKYIVSGSRNQTISFWDFENGKQVRKTNEKREYSTTAIAVAPNGKHIVSGSSDGTICIIDMEPRVVKTIKIHPLSFVGLDFSLADISDAELKETLRQNGAKVDSN